MIKPVARVRNIDGPLLEAMQSRGMLTHEISYLQQVIVLCRDAVLITESTAAACTVTQSISWADSVLRQYHNSGAGQPRFSYVEIAYAGAVAACNSLPSIEVLPTARTWQNRLRSNTAADLKSVLHGDDLQEHVSQVFGHALMTPDAPSSTVHRWALEVAAALTEQQRSADRLVDEAIGVLTRRSSLGEGTRKLLEQLLWAPDRRHIAVLGVSGTRRLLQLESMKAPAVLRQIEPDRPKQFRGWGHAGSKASDFVAGVAAGRIDVGEARLRPSGPHAFVSVEVDAADTGAAFARARAVLGEALDQYVAGHPTVRLTIDPLGAAALPDSAGSFSVQDERGTPLPELDPLVVNWPVGLLTALRMANMMRSSAAPLTRAALCWVTLESAGVRPQPEYRERIGKALALHGLRQEFFRAYRQLVSNAGANNEVEQRHTRNARSLRGKAKRLLSVSSDVPVAEQLHLYARRTAVQAILHDQLALLYRQEASRRQELLMRLGVAAPDAVYSSGSMSRLHDFDGWSRLLRYRSVGAVAQSQQEIALGDLASGATLSTRSILDRLSDQAHRPDVALNALQGRARWLEDAVAALYVCRNLHLHSGVSELVGAVNLGKSGPLIVDALFEMWSAWYEAGTTMDPMTILAQMSGRFDKCLDLLGAGAVPETLDLRRITGATWTPQARS